MKLSVIATGSSGNCYALEYGDDTILLLDCGVNAEQLQRGLGERIERVTAALITHEHKDHSKGMNVLRRYGIPAYMSRGTADALGEDTANIMEQLKLVQIGPFAVLPFRAEHDANEPLGFLIRVSNGDLLVYLTDSFYCEYRFPGVTHWLIECNFIDSMLDSLYKSNPALAKRLRTSHMSLNRLLELFKANDLTQTADIVLCHLSVSRSDERRMIGEITAATGKRVIAADAGMEIELQTVAMTH